MSSSKCHHGNCCEVFSWGAASCLPKANVQGHHHHESKYGGPGSQLPIATAGRKGRAWVLPTHPTVPTDLSATSPLFSNTSRNGGPTTSLGSRFQCLTTLLENNNFFSPKMHPMRARAELGLVVLWARSTGGIFASNAGQRLCRKWLSQQKMCWGSSKVKKLLWISTAQSGSLLQACQLLSKERGKWILYFWSSLPGLDWDHRLQYQN